MTADGMLRTGRRNPQTLYLQAGPEPAGTDPSIGWATDAETLKHAVAAVNTNCPLPGRRWWAAGGPDGALIYNKPGAALTGGWIIAVASREVADRIVRAVNGDQP